MGVLYDLYLQAHGVEWPKSRGRVPDDVLEWGGVSRDLEETVVMHNDQGRNFFDIAAIVEAHFARLGPMQQFEEAGRIVEQAIEKARHVSSTRRAEEIV